MIEEYHFGYIKILGKEYTYDVEVRWDGQVLSWWRKASHIIDAEDVKRALGQGPDLIIIGTGASGIARVIETTEKEIKARDVELLIVPTDEAIKSFNNAIERTKAGGQEKKVIGLFHLTC